MPFRLFTTYFADPNDQRQAELDAALRHNAAIFDSLYVMAERVPAPPDGFSCHWIDSSERPKFRDVLLLATSMSAAEDVVVIANTDICFSDPAAPPDSAELTKIDANLQPNQAYCLARWDMIRGRLTLFDKPYTQDSWIFRGPPSYHIGGNYYFGIPGVDNKIAYELDAAGYEVHNPSRDIRTYHLHASQQRTETNIEANRVPAPYLWIDPAHLGEAPEYWRLANYKSKRPGAQRRPRYQR